jgi:hypothetical protein
MEQFLAMNPNPILRVEKDGTVLYSNTAGESLLHEWGVVVGQKLPPDITYFIQKVISENIPEKVEVELGSSNSRFEQKHMWKTVKFFNIS